MVLTLNKLAIGALGTNLSGAISATTVPEGWSGSWEDNLALAKMSDEAGQACSRRL